ncbi:GNAT family N-acetyltransferase [Ensifer sp. ENS03]|nr:GNAT family protein [Ensifer sp. ENS03]MBD9560655.1 GNAT family N-acetyltransferase [Ensifer sp. ENS03]
MVRDMIKAAIADGLRDGTLAVLTISDASSDLFLGSLMLFDIKPDDAEIGCWVAPEHRGREVSGRALALAMEMGRKLGLKKLRARTVQENPASQKFLLKVGFEQVGEARPEIVPSGMRMILKFLFSGVPTTTTPIRPDVADDLSIELAAWNGPVATDKGNSWLCSTTANLPLET